MGWRLTSLLFNVEFFFGFQRKSILLCHLIYPERLPTVPLPTLYSRVIQRFRLKGALIQTLDGGWAGVDD